MKGIRVGSLLAAGIATAVVLAGCAAPTPTPEEGSTETFSIGYQGPLTGDNAAFGSYARAGIEVALADYYEAYPDGPTVEIVYGDTQGDPAAAPSVATDFINDDSLLGVVGPSFSGETAATAPAYTEAGIPTVSQSATRPDLSEQGWTSFHRVVANDAAQGPAAAQLLTDILGFTTVYVVDDSSDYGVGLGDQVRDTLGAVAVGSDKVQVGDTDFSATVTKVKDSGAEAIYYAGYAPEAALFLKQLRDGGYEGVFGSGDGTVDAAFLDAGDFTEGTVLTFPGILDAGDEFTAKYEALEVSDPGTIGAYTLESYDAAWVLLSGIGEGNTTREDLLAWTSGYDAEGLTKHLKFTEGGEVDGASGVYYYTVEDGVAVLGGPIE